MDTNISNSWWDNYRKTVKATKRFRELVNLVGNSEETAQKMLKSTKKKYPGKEDIWCLNKLVAEMKEVKEDNTIGLAY